MNYQVSIQAINFGVKLHPAFLLRKFSRKSWDRFKLPKIIIMKFVFSKSMLLNWTKFNISINTVRNSSQNNFLSQIYQQRNQKYLIVEYTQQIRISCNQPSPINTIHEQFKYILRIQQNHQSSKFQENAIQEDQQENPYRYFITHQELCQSNKILRVLRQIIFTSLQSFLVSLIHLKSSLRDNDGSTLMNLLQLAFQRGQWIQTDVGLILIKYRQQFRINQEQFAKRSNHCWTFNRWLHHRHLSSLYHQPVTSIKQKGAKLLDQIQMPNYEQAQKIYSMSSRRISQGDNRMPLPPNSNFDSELSTMEDFDDYSISQQFLLKRIIKKQQKLLKQQANVNAVLSRQNEYLKSKIGQIIQLKTENDLFKAKQHQSDSTLKQMEQQSAQFKMKNSSLQLKICHIKQLKNEEEYENQKLVARLKESQENIRYLRSYIKDLLFKIKYFKNLQARLQYANSQNSGLMRDILLLRQKNACQAQKLKEAKQKIFFLSNKFEIFSKLQKERFLEQQSRQQQILTFQEIIRELGIQDNQQCMILQKEKQKKQPLKELLKLQKRQREESTLKKNGLSTKNSN